MFARRNFLEIELRPVPADGSFEQGVYIFQFFFELGAILIGIFTEHRYRALVFSSRNLFEIHAVTVEHAIEVGNLRQHPDGAENGKRRRVDLRGNAGHQVAAAGRDLVDAHR